MEQAANDQPFYVFAWAQLVRILIRARRQTIRSLGALRSAALASPWHPRVRPRGPFSTLVHHTSMDTMLDIAAISSLASQPLWQASWTRGSAQALPAAMEQDLPELYLDHPRSLAMLLER